MNLTAEPLARPSKRRKTWLFRQVMREDPEKRERGGNPI
jgi:hypothetical protein